LTTIDILLVMTFTLVFGVNHCRPEMRESACAQRKWTQVTARKTTRSRCLYQSRYGAIINQTAQRCLSQALHFFTRNTTRSDPRIGAALDTPSCRAFPYALPRPARFLRSFRHHFVILRNPHHFRWSVLALRNAPPAVLSQRYPCLGHGALLRRARRHRTSRMIAFLRVQSHATLNICAARPW